MTQTVIMKKVSKILGLFFLFLGFSCLITNASAFTVTNVIVNPTGYSTTGTSMNVTSQVYISGAFPSADVIQFYTDLENPHWTYNVIVNGVENLRPTAEGSTFTISGFELSYKSSDVVSVKMTLTGNIPVNSSPSQILIKIQELDSSGDVVSGSVFTRIMPVTPTPTPTPAYGSISVSSIPSGANIYLDNAIKGLTALTMDNIANGNHVVIVRLSGYLDWTQNVTVLSNSTSLTANLVAITNTTTITPTPTPTLNSTTNGSIYVQSTPSRSKVFLNNVFQDYTPMTLYNLTAGSTPLVTVRSAGYNEWSQNVAVTSGSTTYVTASLVLASEETTVTTSVPQTTVTTMRPTAKSTLKVPTPWPTSTPTKPSPIGIEIGIIATIGAAILVIKRK